MTLNASGPISLAGTTPGQSIELELGGSGTATISLLDPAVRTLAGVPSGPITMPTNFYSKSSTFPVPITSNQNNINLRTLALSLGWDGVSQVQLTINSGVTVSSTSASTAALVINGVWPNGVTLINNGIIQGKGGTGGKGGSGSGGPGCVGQAGGTALFVSSAASINNANTLAGGGGGGGGGAQTAVLGGSGGGGGGGASFGVGGPRGCVRAGVNGATPGSPGTATAGGSGGIGAAPGYSAPAKGGNGGAGGALGTAGSSGTRSADGTYAGYAGGAAGYAVVGNSNITWISTGTRIGPIA